MSVVGGPRTLGALYAGIDLGGTNIAGVMADADGLVRAEANEPTRSEEGPDGVLTRIARMIDALAGEAGARPSAVGVPGLVDLERGRTRFLPNFPTQWRDVPVRDALAPRAGCEVHLLNDARAATLGELTYGHGRGSGTMVFFSVGTGVGGGVAIDGRLRLGPLGAAGELGHQTIVPDGPLCGCGNRGCLEALASGPALAAEGVRLVLSGQAPRLRETVGGDLAAVTPGTMAEAAAAGDAAVRAAIDRVAAYLGVGAANMVVALHPDLVVFGGGVAELGDLLLDGVRAEVRRRVGMLPAGSVRIDRSLLGARAGVLGAVALAAAGGLRPAPPARPM